MVLGRELREAERGAGEAARGGRVSAGAVWRLAAPEAARVTRPASSSLESAPDPSCPGWQHLHMSQGQLPGKQEGRPGKRQAGSAARLTPRFASRGRAAHSSPLPPSLPPLPGTATALGVIGSESMRAGLEGQEARARESACRMRRRCPMPRSRPAARPPSTQPSSLTLETLGPAHRSSPLAHTPPGPPRRLVSCPRRRAGAGSLRAPRRPTQTSQRQTGVAGEEAARERRRGCRHQHPPPPFDARRRCMPSTAPACLSPLLLQALHSPSLQPWTIWKGIWVMQLRGATWRLSRRAWHGR
jgi:hypothetical protein